MAETEQATHTSLDDLKARNVDRGSRLELMLAVGTVFNSGRDRLGHEVHLPTYRPGPDGSEVLIGTKVTGYVVELQEAWAERQRPERIELSTGWCGSSPTRDMPHFYVETASIRSFCTD